MNLLGSWDRRRQVDSELRHSDAEQVLEHSVGRAMWV